MFTQVAASQILFVKFQIALIYENIIISQIFSFSQRNV